MRPGEAVRVELSKLAAQRVARLALGVCLVAPLGFALVLRLQSAVPADTLYGRWSKTTGFASSLTVLGFAGSLGIPILAGVLAGDLFSSEDRYGTWKTILTRSATRADIFAAKTGAACAYAAAAVLAVGLSSLAGGVALIGSAPLVGLSGQLVSPWHATALVAASWAYTLLPTLAFVALALLLSAVTRSGIAGVLGPAVAGLVLQLLALAGPGTIGRAVLLSTPFDAWHGLLTAPRHWEPVVQGALTSAAYTAIFLAVTWSVLRRRSFAGAEAVTHHRWRTPSRAGIAAAAVITLLVGVSGLGPSEITSRRLESAVSPTFERLVSLQYLWRTHRQAPPNAAVGVSTSCRRAGGARRGPGDDWSCVIRVVHPQVTGATLTLDVTVRANGCYTAQAPPSIVGPLLLRDTRGRRFVNPLYAFDGCFGSA